MSVSEQLSRCSWARTPAAVVYHDCEWGTPVHDDRTLFEFLVLEGAQAGLSWDTILAKRGAYRVAFADFELRQVAAFNQSDVARLLGDAGIVRNRAKIDSAIGNARAVMALAAEYGSFAAFVWRYVDGVPLRNRPRTAADVPATTGLAEKLSRDLRSRGCRFVGPTIVYSFMQAVGMVDDHLATCFRATPEER
ncbi:MAG: DNA-3-methyladenine glycosylase I [Candidatus Eremiobacteraeota bacterium]|nr:DNA-3-methyladenine glycosylase I [Candidatus Eremiobacteraeota bacterium]MBC5803600.1 DNA-3-methyladenine glycosylase I [Candidatus Eremiobacteraeota bacterium]MBC5822679.1 DNA-3-methyladenine glycosylase I [Candidatus Eremiobacteraeota bacterium]